MIVDYANWNPSVINVCMFDNLVGFSEGEISKKIEIINSIIPKADNQEILIQLYGKEDIFQAPDSFLLLYEKIKTQKNVHVVFYTDLKTKNLNGVSNLIKSLPNSGLVPKITDYELLRENIEYFEENIRYLVIDKHFSELLKREDSFFLDYLFKNFELIFRTDSDSGFFFKKSCNNINYSHKKHQCITCYPHSNSQLLESFYVFPDSTNTWDEDLLATTKELIHLKQYKSHIIDGCLKFDWITRFNNLKIQLTNICYSHTNNTSGIYKIQLGTGNTKPLAVFTCNNLELTMKLMGCLKSLPNTETCIKWVNKDGKTVISEDCSLAISEKTYLTINSTITNDGTNTKEIDEWWVSLVNLLELVVGI